MRRFLLSSLIVLTCSSIVFAVDSMTLIQGIQAPSPAGTPIAPSGMQQKGRVGELLSNIFHPTGLIKSEYLAATTDITNRPALIGNIPFWNGLEYFEASTMSQSGGFIGIGTTQPQYRLHVAGSIGVNASLYQKNVTPTYYFLDTNQRSAMINVNNSYFTVARGAGSESTTFQPFNGRHPLRINLENNDATFGGKVRMPVVTGSGDTADTVATKGYVDSLVGSGVVVGEDVPFPLLTTCAPGPLTSGSIPIYRFGVSGGKYAVFYEGTLSGWNNSTYYCTRIYSGTWEPCTCNFSSNNNN